MADPNVFEDAVARVERIGEAAGVGGEVVDALRQPKAVLTADLPVRMDDGSTRHFLVYRCRQMDPGARVSIGRRAPQLTR